MVFLPKKELLPKGTGGFRPSEAKPPTGSARRFLFLIMITKRPYRRGLRQLPHGKSSFFIGKKFFGRESRWSRAVVGEASARSRAGGKNHRRLKVMAGVALTC